MFQDGGVSEVSCAYGGTAGPGVPAPGPRCAACAHGIVPGGAGGISGMGGGSVLTQSAYVAGTPFRRYCGQWSSRRLVARPAK